MTDTFFIRDESRVPPLPPTAPGGEEAPAGAPPIPQRPQSPASADYDRILSGIQESGRAQQDIFRARQDALQPLRSAQLNQLRQPIPQAPTPRPVAPAPEPQQFRENSMLFAGAMAVLGAVASRYTRMSGQAALAAYGGAIKGWQEGNQQAYENAAKQWEQNTRATIQNNNSELEKYRQIMENHRLTIDQMSAQIQIVAAQHQDAMMFQAAQSQNFTMQSAIVTARENAGRQAQQAVDRVAEGRAKDQRHLETTAAYWQSPEGVARRQIPQGQPGALTPEQQTAIDRLIQTAPRAQQAETGGPQIGVLQPTGEIALPPGMTRESLDRAAERYNQTGTFPPNINRGQAGASERLAVQNRAGQLSSGRGESASAGPQQWQQFRAQQTNLQRFQSGPQGNMIRSFNVLVDHLGTLDQLGRALENNDVQAVNRIANAFATQTGRPAPTNFNLAKEIIGDEIIKAVVGSGALADREAIKRQLDAANSPAQLREAINRVVRPLALGQLNGLRHQYETATGRHDFDTMLMPTTREFFGQQGGHGGGGGSPPAAPAPPRVGEQMDGRTYLGGDPADRASWR